MNKKTLLIVGDKHYQLAIDNSLLKLHNFVTYQVKEDAEQFTITALFNNNHVDADELFLVELISGQVFSSGTLENVSSTSEFLESLKDKEHYWIINNLVDRIFKEYAKDLKIIRKSYISVREKEEEAPLLINNGIKLNPYLPTSNRAVLTSFSFDDNIKIIRDEFLFNQALHWTDIPILNMIKELINNNNFDNNLETLSLFLFKRYANLSLYKGDNNNPVVKGPLADELRAVSEDLFKFIHESRSKGD